MSILPLSAFLSSAAGRALAGWAQNAARSQWGLFYHNGGMKLSTVRQNILGREVKSFINSFLPGERLIFPEASLFSVTLSEDFSISNAPKADGNYTSLDKAKNPQIWEATLLCDGHISPVFSPKALIPDIAGLSALENRKSFLDKLRSLVMSRQYLKFRIPEGEFIVTLKAYKITRNPENIEMIEAVLSLQEANPAEISAKDLLKSPKDIGTLVPKAVSAVP